MRCQQYAQRLAGALPQGVPELLRALGIDGGGELQGVLFGQHGGWGQQARLEYDGTRAARQASPREWARQK